MTSSFAVGRSVMFQVHTCSLCSVVKSFQAQKRGVDLHSQARELSTKFTSTLEDGLKTRPPFPKVQDRVAVACDIGKRIVQRTLQECHRNVKKMRI